jgi:ubiquitin thioesterase protein OTUB1
MAEYAAGNEQKGSGEGENGGNSSSWTREGVSDDAISQQQAEIRAEVNEQQKQVGDLESLTVLLEEYRDNAAFHPKISSIIEKYSGIRRSRGDGSCFYRSFIFGYLDTIKNSKERMDKMVQHADGVKAQLLELNYPEFTVSDFHENYVDVLKDVSGEDGRGVSTEELVSMLRDQGVDQYTVYFTRLIASAYMQKNPDNFFAFCMAMGHNDIKSFCASQVEASYVDADQLQIVALTESFKVGTRIVYLDGSTGELNHHDFPEGLEPEIHLLYRPGHYDILYPKE